jgi:magnesium transporter
MQSPLRKELQQLRSVVRRPRLSGIKRRTEPGAVPGTLAPPPEAPKPVIDVIAYGEGEDFVERTGVTLAEITKLLERYPVVWINVTGLGEIRIIEQIGDKFGLHRLSLEDVVNVHQRPKVEVFEDHLFLVVRMVQVEDEADTEQVSMFLGKGYLLTFQEKTGDCFNPVRKRIRRLKGRIRSAGADYLCYALIDAVVDGYFPVLEHYGEKLELLEDRVVEAPRAEQVRELHECKRHLLLLRRAIWPQREMINTLIRDDHQLISKTTKPYLRDCYDHAIQLMDIVETFREIASGLLDIYISSTSAKLNEIMKVLTIIATIFIPLGFIASLYGMNFDRMASPWNMPELGWRYGYPLALLLMLAVAGGLIWYFWRKGWLGNRPGDLP